MNDLFTTFWLPMVLEGKMTSVALMEKVAEFNKALRAFQKETNVVLHDDSHERGTFSSWPHLRKETIETLDKNKLSIIQHPGGTDEHPLMVVILKHDNGYFERYVSPMTKESTYLKPREMGSHITYFKRYTYMSVLGIATDEDKENDLDKQHDNHQKDRAASKKCSVCGKPMCIRKSAKTGAEFWGCSGYPACTNIAYD